MDYTLTPNELTHFVIAGEAKATPDPARFTFVPAVDRAPRSLFPGYAHLNEGDVFVIVDKHKAPNGR